MNRRASLASLIAETLLTFHAAALADEPRPIGETRVLRRNAVWRVGVTGEGES